MLQCLQDTSALNLDAPGRHDDCLCCTGSQKPIAKVLREGTVLPRYKGGRVFKELGSNVVMVCHEQNIQCLRQ